MRRCLSRLLESDIPDPSWEVANLPFSIGGLGLRKGSRISAAAYWASWADCLHTVQSRHPVLGVQISAALSQGGIGQHMEAAATCRERLLDVGVEAPLWEDVARGAQRRQNVLDDAEPGVLKHGWQFVATQKVEDCFLAVQCGRERLIRLEPFSGPRVVTWPGCRSLVFPRLCIPVSIPSPSAFFSCGASGSLCPVLLAAASVAFHSILVAITVQPAQWQVFWGEGVLQLRARQLVCVVKLGPESP